MLNINAVYLYIGLIFFMSCLFISCSDEKNNNVLTPAPVDSSDFRYPFTDGSTWNYTITATASDIQPDSILHYFSNYPLVISGTVTILYDTLINSVLTKCFLDEGINAFAYSNRYYYINNDTSLILYAQREGLGSGLLPLKKIKTQLSNLEFDNLKSINYNELKVNGDILYSTLKYPMTTGTEWTNENFFGYVTKKYLGFENISSPDGIISCMKEQNSYSYFLGTFYNYYSKYGLMKTYSFINDIDHTTVNSPDGDGTFDSKTEAVITGYHIPSAK